MKMKESQFLLIKEQLKKLTGKECFYKHKLEGINVDQIQSQEDFEKLPFTWKGDLREAYPLGLMAEPEDKIVRIHSSSGTTGTPVIIPYTQQDVCCPCAGGTGTAAAPPIQSCQSSWQEGPARRHASGRPGAAAPGTAAWHGSSSPRRR